MPDPAARRPSAAEQARLRGLYDRVVDAAAQTMPEGQALTFRHACGLAWHRLDCIALAQRRLDGTLSEDQLLAALLPFVREALAAAAPPSPTQSGAKRLH